MGNDFKDLFGDWRPDDEFPNSESGSDSDPERRPDRALNEKECRVVNVFEGIIESGERNDVADKRSFFVLLRDNQGRDLRIFVIRDVAYAISLALEGDEPGRPYTHDLTKNIIEKLNATVERVTIDDLWQEVYYARIVLETSGGQTIDIDSRPSDAIALALRFRAPIYVADAILEAAQQE